MQYTSLPTSLVGKNIKRPSFFWFFTEGVRALFEYVLGVIFISRLKVKTKGDGHPVIAIPGLLCTDFSMHLLRWLVNKLGFTAYGWALGRNMGDLVELRDLKRLNARIDEIYAQTNQKITLIGWSMGGIYAREVAKQRPELFQQVITMGSPFSDIYAPNNVKWIYEKITDVDAIDPVWVQNVPNPATVPTTAIYSKQDGIVPWEACLENIEDTTHQNREVQGSHWGLGTNPNVFKIVAEKLAIY